MFEDVEEVRALKREALAEVQAAAQGHIDLGRAEPVQDIATEIALDSSGRDADSALFMRFPSATFGSEIQRGVPRTRFGRCTLLAVRRNLPGDNVYRRRRSSVDDRIRRPASENCFPDTDTRSGDVKGDGAGGGLPDIIVEEPRSDDAPGGRSRAKRNSRPMVTDLIAETPFQRTLA